MENLSSGPAGGAGISSYSESVDSSPRSRGGESWDEPFPSSAAAAAASSKLRFMCSYGGRIVPRPTDKSLCYLGGETRIVVVDRHCSLADLHARLARTLPLGGLPFLLKYQLPSEDLDSLISVTTDEDLDNLIEEYDRLLQSSSSSSSSASAVTATATSGSNARSSRLRLFLFPAKPESAPSSINSLLDDSKSESWFVDALNGAMAAGALPRGLSADSASVNCLLGLEDDLSVHSRAGGSAQPVAPAEPEQISLARPDSYGRLASVPDSPMLETTSSFGSASSVPFLSNLPPIRVRPDDRPPDPRLEDHFAHMNLSAPTAAAGQRPEDGFKEAAGYAPNQHPPPPPIPLPNTSVSTPTISPTENPSRVFSSDDEKSEHGGVRKPPQSKLSPTDTPSSESIVRQPVYYQDRVPSTVSTGNPTAEPKREIPASDPGYRVPIQVPDQSYMLSAVQQERLHHHQQQFIQANPHFVHHPGTGTVLTMPSYYPVSAHPIQHAPQAHMFDRQIPTMYYVPVHQNPAAYNLGVQPHPGDAASAPPSTKPAIPVPNQAFPPSSAARTGTATMPQAAPAPPLIQLAADQAHAYPGMGYHLMHQHLSQTTAAVPNYGYEFADPAHPQMYYAQSTSPPSMVPQYQMVSSATVIPEALPADVKQTRAS